jgi:O-antigen/teichoic acid export membrane protein
MDKKLLKWNFIFQYGWVLTNIFNSLLLLPLYLKNIDKDTLGIWLATGNILGWMTLVDPGVGEVLQQKIAELRGQKQDGEIGKTIGSGFIASVFILLVSVVLGFLCYFFIGALINKDVSRYPHLSSALVMSIMATGLSLVSFSLSGINQGLHNAQQVAISSLSANFLFLFVNLIFLYLGFGVLSIALANLFRALYINMFNIGALLRALKKIGVQIVFDRLHFKRFIRIFSFTSLSKIITGLSYSVDMIVLARYIPPSMITVYEINKRPVNIAYSLIGRHSVALMPLISHAKGSGDKSLIMDLVNKQFRFYSYAAMFCALGFCFNYEYLISAWTGPGQYAGNFILYLLVGSFFLSLMSYFMATVGYALGDIKMNSLYNIIRNIFYGVLMFFAARHFGIPGTLVVSISVTLLADLFFYTYRLHRLGYLDRSLITDSLRRWSLVLPIAGLAGWGISQAVKQIIPNGFYLARMVVNGGTYTLCFLLIILLTDGTVRQWWRLSMSRYVLTPFNKLFLRT